MKMKSGLLVALSCKVVSALKSDILHEESESLLQREELIQDKIERELLDGKQHTKKAQERIILKGIRAVDRMLKDEHTPEERIVQGRKACEVHYKGTYLHAFF